MTLEEFNRLPEWGKIVNNSGYMLAKCYIKNKNGEEECVLYNGISHCYLEDIILSEWHTEKKQKKVEVKNTQQHMNDTIGLLPWQYIWGGQIRSPHSMCARPYFRR